MFDSLKDWLSALIKNAFTNFQEAADEAIEIIRDRTSRQDDGEGNVIDSLMPDMWEDMLEYSEVLQPFCYTIVGICLLIEIIQITSKVDVLKWEQGLKVGIKFVLAKVCIDNAPDFLRACYQQSLDWMSGFGGGPLVLSSTLQTTLVNCLDEVSGMGSIIGLFTICMLLFLAINVCALIIKMVAYTRMFEIYSYLVISPLPFAFLPLGSGDAFSINPITSNFIKNYIAACVQGVVIVIGLSIYKNVFGLNLFGQQLGLIIRGNLYAFFGWDKGCMETILEIGFLMLMHSIIMVFIVTKCSSIAKSMISAM